MSTDNLMSGARVLVVDDTPINVRLLQRMLATGGILDVRSTTDPRDTMAIVDQFQPDLILLDINMPHLNGFSVLTALRERCAPNDSPSVIVLTGDASFETMTRALSSGAAAVLTKPFERLELLQLVRKVLLASPREDPAGLAPHQRRTGPIAAPAGETS